MSSFIISGLGFSEITKDEVFVVKKDSYKKTIDFIKSILGDELVDNLISLSDMVLDADVKNKNDGKEDYFLILNTKFEIFSSIILNLFPEDKIKYLKKDEYNFDRHIIEVSL